MSVDPSDDSTFWFTGEYNASGDWSTRIGTFQLEQPTGPEITVTPTSHDFGAVDGWVNECYPEF